MYFFPTQKKHLFIFLLVLVVSVPFLLFTAKEESVKGVTAIKQDIISLADLSIHKFHFTEREKGKRKWEIWADRAERFLSRDLVHMDRVKVEFLLDEGGWVHLSGRLGDYFEKEKRIELSGDVQVQTDSGYTLYADQLVWEEKQKRISSEKPVRMVTERYVIEGERMSYQTDSKKLNLVGGIRTVIYPRVREKGISHEE
jgi:LPS export ABC transporter protein LptC